MGIISRVRGILWARVAKVNGIAKASIARMDAEQPSSDSPGDTFRVAMMVGNSGVI